MTRLTKYSSKTGAGMKNSMGDGVVVVRGEQPGSIHVVENVGMKGDHQSQRIGIPGPGKNG